MRQYLAALLCLTMACTQELDEQQLLTRGIDHRVRGNFDSAIVDYSRALERNPKSAAAYANRGFVYQLKGEYQRSLADFDSAIALKPDHATAIKNRGRSFFYIGDFESAARDLRDGLAYDSSNTYNIIWLHIAMQRLHRDDAADFSRQLARIDTTQWPAAVANFYRGDTDADALMREAKAISNDSIGNQVCAAAFYIGEHLLWKNDTVGAREHFNQTLASCPHRWSEYTGANTELARLARPPR